MPSGPYSDGFTPVMAVSKVPRRGTTRTTMVLPFRRHGGCQQSRSRPFRVACGPRKRRSRAYGGTCGQKKRAVAAAAAAVSAAARQATALPSFPSPESLSPLRTTAPALTCHRHRGGHRFSTAPPTTDRFTAPPPTIKAPLTHKRCFLHRRFSNTLVLLLLLPLRSGALSRRPETCGRRA